jgi:hypothetical protein
MHVMVTACPVSDHAVGPPPCLRSELQNH